MREYVEVESGKANDRPQLQAALRHAKHDQAMREPLRWLYVGFNGAADAGVGRHGPEVKPAKRFRWSMQAEDRAAPCIASLVPLRC
ncbi:hypothetical protein X760_23775 [Mesorhizobium sp. LSHC422A00]|nr:hypothetical protein X767_29710 [Mesorhizobium sp. LSJC264A00]ESX42559.1 hypothetical protein X762_29440 [Mesorhizobium sp. LSHC426A00]ESX48511.1 hypothetical protein X761_28525 [Mesorhizobium sp. LSHC424B00]ESX57053.1 hypothetical protein X760_23775 [Mesorhizobium sp. LSHC422A00]ESX65179.1 hypothetical protein X758_30150 [Mesorhizobium sp. LSHC416B00]ESY15390.1 hypothetical protein X750_28040 [Mesorhizobium sp. LNJC394B00]